MVHDVFGRVCVDNPLSPSCLCHAMSFARSCSALLQLLAFTSTTQGLHFSDKGNEVKLSLCLAVQPDLFASGQKIMVLFHRRASIIQHKPEVTGLGLNASHLQKDQPSAQPHVAGAVGPRDLFHLQDLFNSSCKIRLVCWLLSSLPLLQPPGYSLPSPG